MTGTIVQGLFDVSKGKKDAFKNRKKQHKKSCFQTVLHLPVTAESHERERARNSWVAYVRERRLPVRVLFVTSVTANQTAQRLLEQVTQSFFSTCFASSIPLCLQLKKVPWWSGASSPES